MPTASSARVRFGLVAAAALLLPAALAVPLADEGPWGLWAVQTVDRLDNVNFAQRTALALDADGQAHITFEVLGPGRAVYARPDFPVGWTLFPLESLSYSGGVAIDAADRAHVSWSGASGRTLRVGIAPAFAPSTVETVPSGDAIYASQLHFGPSGREHATYETASGTVRHAFRDGAGAWTLETVDTGVLGFHDSAVGADGRVHVVYEDTVGGVDVVRHAVRAAGGGWSLSTLPWCDWYAAVAVGPNGWPHVSCQDRSQGLLYLVNDGAGWDMSVLDNTVATTLQGDPDSGYYSDIAVDGAGRPHISYSDRNDPTSFANDPTSAQRLTYATSTSIGFVFEEVEHADHSAGDASSIVLDDAGRPRIAYVQAHAVEASNGCTASVQCFDLRYAEPAVAFARLAQLP